MAEIYRRNIFADNFGLKLRTKNFGEKIDIFWSVRENLKFGNIASCEISELAITLLKKISIFRNSQKSKIYPSTFPVMLYVRKRDEQIYQPLHVVPASLSGLALAIANKFGADPDKVSNFLPKIF